MTAEQLQYFHLKKKKVFIINEVSDERPAWNFWIFFFYEVHQKDTDKS